MRFLKLILRYLSRHVFISYSHADGGKVDRLVDQLNQDGFRVWKDDRSIKVGDDWEDEIRRGIRWALAVLLLISHHSVNSSWVLFEAKYALRQRRRILVIKIEPVALPLELAALDGIQWLSLSWDSLTTVVLNPLLKTLRRWQYRDVYAVSVTVLAVATAIIFWPLLSGSPDHYYEVFIKSETLPVEITIDEGHWATLHRNLPATTFELQAGEHLIVAKQGAFRYEKRIHLTEDNSPYILLIPPNDDAR